MDNKGAAVVLQDIFHAAVDSALPGPVVPLAMPEKPRGRCVVIGAGKASAAMAAAVDAAWPDVDLSGVVVTRYGHAVPAGRIRILEAAHPVSDSMSEVAAMMIAEAVRHLTPDDLVLALISGGGSALMALPISGLNLADKQKITQSLLLSGANIREMNLVRRHLSAIKGGKLALMAAPARVVSLIISDVPGDNPSDVASGPTVADTSTPEQALAVLLRYNIPVSPEIRNALLSKQEAYLSPAAQSDSRLIATPAMALKAAAEAARRHGIMPLILGDALEGESRELGIVMAGIARSVKLYGHPVKKPAVLLSGGETTVTVTGFAGKGGRNTEFLLSLACALEAQEGIWAIAGDTDGIDGTEDAAGAIIYPDTISRGSEVGLHAPDYLAKHDSYSFFHATGDLVTTGPTLTNVNDIRAILIS
ncbi:glycerate kinase [Rouxiella silvae]|uniref:Glycerate kinase n=1 Tax=Rouxiella silvae TaxID=1646373 RepID=A0AA40X757_9GAMM|nr:glycerate kinase [Rouxiella silvae]MBF6639760.1 glycerate kinase [Rouxiella silvae]